MLQHRLATPVIQPRMHFFDKEGQPLIGGKVYSFKVGEDIFKPTYRNSEFTAANQNPILLDQAGSALIYVRGSVQLKIYDKSGVFIEEKIVYQQQMRTQFFDKYGKALGSGKVWTYDYQSTIKKPSYENADDTLLNPNPVVLDENGYGSISIVGAYRLRQYDKKGVFISDQDFKRPPARVLTSVVYPLYFEVEANVDFFINNTAVNIAPVFLESLNTGFTINTVQMYQPLTSINPPNQSLNTGFTINTVQMYQPLTSINPPNQSLNTGFTINTVQNSRLLVISEADAQKTIVAFSISGVQLISL
ncbi:MULTISPECIES: hypothetical protein [unclassified Acinetobacter]|uniref:hypothetical protein n=1 Tax=unclassified Acinetobacter TaxID=196816 RepID=UPI0015D2831B|nr:MULTISPECIES: hypothetical protein [unclassified Acinetobacter]